MSLTLSKAAHLKPEIRLTQAVYDSEADLSTEQQNTFRTQSSKPPPDIHDVMRVTAEFDRRQSRTGLRCFGTRLVNFLKIVQQFAAVGDLLISGSQSLIACGVWTAVRLTLVSIVTFISNPDKLTAFFMRVGRSAPCFEEMALLYPRSKNLQSFLSEYFIIVVQFCHKLLKMSKQSAFRQLASSLSDSDMSTYEAELNNWAESIKQEINLLGLRDQKSGLKFLHKLSKSEAKRRKLEAKSRILNSCSKYDYQAAWTEIRKAGNSTLFNPMPEYSRWKAREESCTLVCKGRLGSGKSVWLANMLDDLNLHVHSAQTPVAFFFCRHDISESLKAHTVICCLARQLLANVSDLTEVEKILDDTTPTLDFDTLLRLLICALPRSIKPFFVLDWLDECGDDQRSQLIQQLRTLQNNFALHICVSFRVEVDDLFRLNPSLFSNHSIIAIPKENPDIKGFIAAQLDSCLDSGRLAIGDPGLIFGIQDTLLQGAQGMFLWVALQIESLCDAKTDEALRQALADLPRDLLETYSRILQRSGERGKDYQQRALELITMARRPLTTEELQEALSVVPGDTAWNPSRLLNDVYSTLRCCGSLITVDEEELTVRLVHQSVKQFLLGEFEGSARAVFTRESAERTMGNIVVTYLNYGVFDTQVSRTVIPQIAANKVTSKVIDAAIPSSSTRNLARMLLRSRG